MSHTTAVDQRLKGLGIDLPTPLAPVANYLPFVEEEGLLYISGQLPMVDGKPSCLGLLGNQVSIEQAVEAARLCAINLIAQAKIACGGDLSRIRRVLKLTGFVAATADFTDHPKVMNGASDLMVDVFGDLGRHARAAVGVGSLPMGVPVEVEAIFVLGPNPL